MTTAATPDPIAALTTERGRHYGHPADHFATTTALMATWRAHRQRAAAGQSYPPRMQQGIEHAVYMILDKLSRLAQTPDHADSWDDVQGYARCAQAIIAIFDEGATA